MSGDNSLKTGARHSSADMTHINHVAAHAKAIAAHAAALGADEDMPDVLPMKALPDGVDPTMFAAGECSDIQMAAGALWTMATLLQSETLQDTDDPSVSLLTAAARQLIAYISGELDDIEQAGAVEDAPAEDVGVTMAGKGDTVYAPVASIKSIGDYTLLIKGIVRGGKDLTDETFMKDTDLGFSRSPIGMPVFYDHAKRGIKSQVGQVTAWEDTGDSIDFTVELDRAKRYAAEIMRLNSEKALGGSTGALGHLVVAENGMLKRWIVGELSLTPTPAEPRTRPDLRDTKSAEKPETTPETARSAVAARSVLPALVSGYMSLIEHDIHGRHDRLRRTH